MVCTSTLPKAEVFRPMRISDCVARVTICAICTGAGAAGVDCGNSAPPAGWFVNDEAVLGSLVAAEAVSAIDGAGDGVTAVVALAEPGGGAAEAAANGCEASGSTEDEDVCVDLAAFAGFDGLEEEFLFEEDEDEDDDVAVDCGFAEAEPGVRVD